MQQYFNRSAGSALNSQTINIVTNHTQHLFGQHLSIVRFSQSKGIIRQFAVELLVRRQKFSPLDEIPLVLRLKIESCLKGLDNFTSLTVHTQQNRLFHGTGFKDL